MLPGQGLPAPGTDHSPARRAVVGRGARPGARRGAGCPAWMPCLDARARR